MKKILVSSTVFVLFSVAAYSQYFNFDKYQPGYYFDSSGNKVSGMLKFTYGARFFENKKFGVCELLFKDEKGEKKQKFKSNEVQSFVIGSDSFTVVKDINISGFMNYPQDFARVIRFGKINLYEYLGMVATGNGGTVTAKYYLVQKDGKLYIALRSAMKSILATVYFSDYPELKGEMNKKKIRMDDLPLLTEKYNNHFANLAAKP